MPEQLVGGKAQDSGQPDENLPEKHGVELIAAPPQQEKTNSSGRAEAEAAQTPLEG